MARLGWNIALERTIVFARVMWIQEQTNPATRLFVETFVGRSMTLRDAIQNLLDNLTDDVIVNVSYNGPTEIELLTLEQTLAVLVFTYTGRNWSWLPRECAEPPR